ncbi:MAG: plasma-membrane proton-efflux P-type ATPase [Lentisphaerae bacterium GWF2_45_14]|nr:MAG: plasma-membrane proton-efflux P-type ATPase [Lentisphaerae bacterium GWF2_45_14]
MSVILIDTDKAQKEAIDSLLKDLSSDMAAGLTQSEAESRMNEYGLNELEEKKESLLIKFFRNFWGPIPWMIEIAAILSAIIEHWDDFAIIAFLLLLNACIEFFQEYKAGNAIDALKKRLASKTRVLRDGKWAEMEARLLVPGDIIRVRLGDIIPADIKLLKGDYLLVDEAALTGESLPVEKHESDIAYSGSIAKQGEMLALVYGTATNTFFGRTAKLVSDAKTESHFQKAVEKIGDYLIALNFVLVSIIVVAGLFRHQSFWELIQFSLVLTVAAIPSAMPAVLSVTMAAGALMLSKKGAIVSKLVAIEEMAGMDILCSDKTGTITQNVLTVKGFKIIGDFKEEDIILYSSLSSKAENHDPIDDAILEKLNAREDLKKQISGFKENKFKPFDPVSKRTESEICGSDAAIFKVTKGAPQVIIDLCKDKDIIAEQVNKMVDEAGVKGYRTLGVAKTNAAGDWVFVGLICLEDPPREDSAATIKSAQELGVKVKMITGDHGAIAKEIAKQVNIGPNIFPAKELSDAPDRKALQLVESADGFSQVFPEHKYEIVELLQKHNHIVGMTGDGVNDAPALKKADTGIAVAGATDAAKSAASIVFTRPGLSVIVDAIKESRKIFQRMQSYAIYRISETQDVLFFTVLAILIFREYPVTAIMIVMLAVFNDFPIMAIAYDNAKFGNKPEQWEMRKVIGIGTVLGLTNVIFTFLIFYIGLHWLNADYKAPSLYRGDLVTEYIVHMRNWMVGTFGSLSFPQVQTLVFAELAIAGNMTVFLSRSKGPMWSIAPGKGILLSSLISKVIVSLICAFGFMMAPIGWYVLFVWIYASFQMLITDRVKLMAYDLFDHKGIRFGRRQKINS